MLHLILFTRSIWPAYINIARIFYYNTKQTDTQNSWTRFTQSVHQRRSLCPLLNFFSKTLKPFIADEQHTHLEWDGEEKLCSKPLFRWVLLGGLKSWWIPAYKDYGQAAENELVIKIKLLFFFFLKEFLGRMCFKILHGRIYRPLETPEHACQKVQQETQVLNALMKCK